jgi:hypothetical protein
MDSSNLSLTGRLLIGLPLVMSGLGKLTTYGPTTAMIAAVGLPIPPLAYVVAVALELGGTIMSSVAIGGTWKRLSSAIRLSTAPSVRAGLLQSAALHSLRDRTPEHSVDRKAVSDLAHQ